MEIKGITGLSVTLILALALGAATAPAPAAAADPFNNHNIAAIDLRSGTVTTTEIRTGRTFQFTVADAAPLRGLKVGQVVYANFTTMQVSLHPNGAEPFNIVNLGPVVQPLR